MKRDIDICYLCGQKLTGKTDRDHVPPKQFYAQSIRKQHNPSSLLTLPVHAPCNKSYQKDEVYFTHSVGCTARDSYSGRALWDDLSNQYKKPRGNRIAKMIFKEFDRRPSGISLPSGKVAKNFDGKRIRRVLWKITRGLFFWETSRFLPEHTPAHFEIVSPDTQPPERFSYIANAPSKGKYPGVFDYKYDEIADSNVIHAWAMLLWDRIICLIAFHDPDCVCDTCEHV